MPALPGEECPALTQDSTTLGLFMTHRGALVDYANGIVGSRAQAEDLVQEAWLRFDKAARQRRLDQPLGYLYRIVRNLALDRRRSSASAEIAADAALSHMAAPVATPEQSAIHRDRLRVLAEALAELPPRTQIAFNMHRIEGRSLKEVANRLGVSVVRAHQLVKDAIRHGAKKLDAAD